MFVNNQNCYEIVLFDFVMLTIGIVEFFSKSLRHSIVFFLLESSSSTFSFFLSSLYLNSFFTLSVVHSRMAYIPVLGTRREIW